MNNNDLMEIFYLETPSLERKNEIIDYINENEYKMTPLCYETLEMCLVRYDNIQIFKHNSGIYEISFDYDKVVEDCEGLIREYLSLLGVEV